LVVGVEERGVRFAAAGEEEVLVLTSRRGVPGGLVAAAADMLFVFSLSNVRVSLRDSGLATSLKQAAVAQEVRREGDQEANAPQGMLINGAVRAAD
jgi:rRNA maturation protein Rpf1